jgi:hypothetical protein
LLTLVPVIVVYASIVLYHTIEIPLARAGRGVSAKLFPQARTPLAERPVAHQALA